MDVDLPDETQETDLLEKGQIQLETALLYNRYKDGGRSSVIGQGLLRYGLLNRVELRLLVEDGRERDKYIKETVQSTSPLAMGTKIALVKEVKGLPDITLVSFLKLPFTSRSNTQKAYWLPIIIAAFQNKFGGNRWKLEYNIGAQQEAYSTDWVAIANGSVHYKIFQQLELFTEYYAQYRPGKQPQHNIGGGVAYELGDMWEVYFSTGSAVYSDNPNHYFDSGIAFRLP